MAFTPTPSFQNLAGIFEHEQTSKETWMCHVIEHTSRRILLSDVSLVTKVPREEGEPSSKKVGQMRGVNAGTLVVVLRLFGCSHKLRLRL